MSKTAEKVLESYFKHLASEGLTEEELQNEELIQDYTHDVMMEHRSGEIETNIITEYSRHYEATSVAMHIKDFEGFTGWIGWTYWYGGGKHGYPGEIEWVCDAYFLELVEEKEVVTIKRTFAKRGE